MFSTSIYLSLPVVVALTFVYHVMPSANAMSLGPLSRLSDLTSEALYDDLPAPTKRSGPDEWGICPDSMPRVDCFYVYLGVYASLRNQAENQLGRGRSRIIGKRSLQPHVDVTDPLRGSSLRKFQLHPVEYYYADSRW